MKLRGTLARVRSLLRRKVRRRWSTGFVEEPWMHERVAVAASWIGESSKVLDLGAGKRLLEQYLPPRCAYTGADLEGVHPDNLILDLDSSFALPDTYDTVVLLGVLEFLERPLSTLDRLRGCSSHVILSYVARRGDLTLSVERRSRVGAKNHWTEDELIAHLLDLGLTIERRHVLSERDTDLHAIFSLRWTVTPGASAGP